METAHEIILRWCRSKPQGEGHPVMRDSKGVDGYKPETRYKVWDLYTRVLKPGSDYEYDDRLIACGESWEAVLSAMRAQGKKL